jgi:hypothetical protein
MTFVLIIFTALQTSTLCERGTPCVFSYSNVRVSTTEFATSEDCQARRLELIGQAQQHGQTVLCARK